MDTQTYQYIAVLLCNLTVFLTVKLKTNPRFAWESILHLIPWDQQLLAGISKFFNGKI